VTPRRALRSVAAAAAVLAVVLAVSCARDRQARPLTGYTREPTPSVADVELALARGGSMPAAPEAADALRVVYFGFTSCPDVCPTTMSDLKRALAQLEPEERARVAVAMVTVDPDRDVPDKLDAYVRTFVPDGDAVRFADPGDLADVASAFGAQYRVDPGDGGEPEVSHSGDLYVVDGDGDLVLQWPFGTSWEDLAADLRTLLARAGTDTQEQT
jgi:protein SCO1/2